MHGFAYTILSLKVSVPCFRLDKPEKKYAQVLGVKQEASDVEIKKAYKKLLLLFHPDKNQGAEKEAVAKFLNICEAYEALGDPQKRADYNMYGKAAFQQPEFYRCTVRSPSCQCTPNVNH